MSKNKKIFWSIISVLIFIAIFSSLLISSKEDGLLVVDLNVGHGDCAILRTGNEYGIIDTGPEESKDIVMDYCDSNNIDEFKFMLISHYDKDHIGNAVDIIENYEVETVFIPDYESSKALYQPLMEALEDEEDVRVISEETTYDWNDVNIQLYPAESVTDYMKDDAAVDNNLSLVSIVSYRDNRLLFSGDVEKDRIKEMLKSGVNYKCDWLKMPHHGRDGKKVDKLIDAVRPKYAIVSCSSEDDFVGNDNEKYLEENNIEIFTTLEHNIITRCNDKGMEVSYE